MAVDRKADHVGNHGGRYTDMDGQTKQFTYIDHDVKSTLRFPSQIFEKEYVPEPHPLSLLKDKNFILICSSEEEPKDYGTYYTNMGPLKFNKGGFIDSNRMRYKDIYWFKQVN